MSTHKHIDKICCVIVCLALLLTVLFMNGEKIGITVAENTSFLYENRIFDTSKVHTIDIVIDDLDSFFEEAEKEEYTMCTVVIDGEKTENVAIRAKGNTSLSQVKNYNNNRYSFKIEFDHYDSTKSYYGLDKLCLNNIIQDNTYMKDYLTYTMMAYQGVCAPMCSYAYITFNGEEFGLYLAVEGIEESFLERNYGSSYGELYKPDSMDMGAGRGNGEKFDMDKFSEKFSEKTDGVEQTTAQDSTTQKESAPDASGTDTTSSDGLGNFEKTDENQRIPDNNGISQGGMQGGFDGNGTPPDMQGGSEQNGNMPQMPQGGMQGGFDGNGTPPDMQGDSEQNGDMPQIPQGDAQQNAENADKNNFQPGNSQGFGGGAMGSSAAGLIYSDDDPESYSDIFESAKTNVTDADKERLISSIKKMNENENIEEAVDTDAVINYFAVHNFVLNFDSYTGSMLHNYYLYEKDGLMSMIPWDYNLAFGGFQSASSATNLVNYPIDSPVSGGDIQSRPMLSWIFASEEYTEKYHAAIDSLISGFFESGEFEKLIDETIELISPYVEKDPTKFCSYDEFTKGAETLKTFCLLRSESIRKQLSGEIGKTSEEQKEDTSAFVKADDINVSDMGSMGGGKRM